MKLKSFILVVMAGSFAFAVSALEPYLDASLPLEVRVEDALGKMTLDEKIAVIHANSKFSSPGVPRLGIPEIRVNDGPQGVREENKWDEWGSAGHTNDSCTAYPALMSVAATWNPEMAYLYGKSIGEEFRYRGKAIALTPGVNIYRHPLCGRNFEYMGEDPYLAGTLAAEAVKGVQSNGVAACVKHFALNNQEVNRHKVNVELSDRALHEIYLPAFHRAVCDGRAWAVMGAYNKYKGEYCCHNSVLNKILKSDWGFDGVFISDWGGTEDTRQAIFNGLDMEFGTFTDGLSTGVSNAYDNYFLALSYKRLIESGDVGLEELDDKVRRVLRLCMRTEMDRTRPYGSLNSPQHSDDSRTIQEEGIVLLKNDGILPVSADNYKRILIVGENADFMLTKWGGSSGVKARYEVMPYDAILRRTAGKCELEYQKGYTSDWPPQPAIQDSLRSEAVKAAIKADLIIFIGGHNKYPGHDTESYDRSGSGAPFRQDELLDELVRTKVPLVMVTMGANQFDMPWRKKIPAMLHAWYGGSEGGEALAEVIFGEVNPSGKLPVTFYERLEDCGAISEGEYPGTEETVRYNEDIFVGYRYVDKNNIKPTFPFGHGLSYTEFHYGKPEIEKKRFAVGDSIKVSIPVTNIGKVPGKEVVQLYVSDDECSLPRPMKELKGYCKLSLQPGEMKIAEFLVAPDDLSFYDDRIGQWQVEPGSFTISFGSSSADLRRKVRVSVF